MRTFAMSAAGAACLLFVGGAVSAQPASRPAHWPERPVRVIAPTLAGGPTDIIIRIVIGKVAEGFDRPFVVDNRPGAGGLIGTDLVAKAPRDGHTLLFTYAAHTIIPFIYAQVPYDVRRDFAPITMTSMQPLLLAVHAGVKANSVQELVAYARENPGKLNLALASPGGSGALAAELFKLTTGTHMVTVPYKGAAQAMPALLSGEMHLIFTSLPSVLPHVKSGKVKVLGVASLKRSQFMTEVPTLIESGIRDFNTSPWQGLLAPAGTSIAVIDLLYKRVVAALELPEVRQRLAAVGTEAEGTSPTEFATFLQQELARNSKVIKAAGMKAE
jgi:tripartite-type tricarboxylate transporter receptor subunit TctC